MKLAAIVNEKINLSGIEYQGNSYYLMCIPIPLEDACFRKPERLIIKMHFLLMVVPLMTNSVLSMICSVFPFGLV
jgi:hypothetical protein